MSHKPWIIVPAIGPIIRTAEAAAYLGISIARYYELAAAGEVPPMRKIGRRASGVPKLWLDAYISHRFSETSGDEK